MTQALDSATRDVNTGGAWKPPPPPPESLAPSNQPTGRGLKDTSFHARDSRRPKSFKQLFRDALVSNNGNVSDTIAVVLKDFKMPDTKGTIGAPVSKTGKSDMPSAEATLSDATPAPDIPAAARAKMSSGFSGSYANNPQRRSATYPPDMVKPKTTGDANTDPTAGGLRAGNTPGDAGRGSPTTNKLGHVPAMPAQPTTPKAFKKSFADAIDSGMSTTDALATALPQPAARPRPSKPPIVKEVTVKHYGPHTPDAVTAPGAAPTPVAAPIARPRPSKVLKLLGRQ